MTGKTYFLSKFSRAFAEYFFAEPVLILAVWAIGILRVAAWTANARFCYTLKPRMRPDGATFDDAATERAIQRLYPPQAE